MKEIVDEFVNDNISKEGADTLFVVRILKFDAGKDKFCCRLDGYQFPSENQIIAHIRNDHKARIEEFLSVIVEGIDCCTSM
jgi:hypothetical protein